MIRHRLFSLLLVVFFLASCGNGENKAENLTNHLKGLQKEEYLSHITASFGSREVSFSLDYSYFAGRPSRVTVIAPEEISGIAFSVTEEETVLEFDGVRLETESYEDIGLSPLSTLPTLISIWTEKSPEEAYPSSMFGEDAILTVYKETKGDLPVEYRAWFSERDFYPLYAEIYKDGERILECKFERKRK